MKWFYLLGVVCGTFICLMCTALFIYAILNHNSRWWAVLVFMAPWGLMTWKVLQFYKEERKAK